MFQKNPISGSVRKSDFDDGFEATPINLDKIKNHLQDPREGRKPVFFLHGAFFIFQYGEGNYEKKLAQEVIQTYSAIDQKLEEYLNGNIDIQDPVIVFSGRPCYKNAALLDDPYLEYCKVRLSREKKIFTFGCSFELDSHILDAIFEPLENKAKKKEIYFGYYSEDDKERIEEYLRKNNKTDENITYVDVSDVDSVNDIIWGQH